jgi:hypothetical protein
VVGSGYERILQIPFGAYHSGVDPLGETRRWVKTETAAFEKLGKRQHKGGRRGAQAAPVFHEEVLHTKEERSERDRLGV